jgi:methionine-rich copper-binding protein CopC
MRTRSSRWPRRTSALLGTLLILGLAVGAATPAQAHNYVVSSTPEAGSVVTVLPEQFTVTTNDVLLDFGGESTGSSGALEVQGPDGLYYGDGCVTVSGPSISTRAALGPAGEYTVNWRVVSTDGHPVSNQFVFTWQPDAGQPVSEGSDVEPVCATAAGAADDETKEDGSGAPETADDEFRSVLIWSGGALLAVVLAVGITLLVLRGPRRGGPARAPVSEHEEGEAEYQREN